MTLRVEIADVQTQRPLTDEMQEALQRLLADAAGDEGVDGEVSLSFVDDAEIHRLNRDFREVDRPTDVLSFALEEDDAFPHFPGEDRQLGDIVISVPRALEQAEAYGHSFERELGFLAVHGWLHLIGYDHQTDEEARAMFDKQEAVLTRHGLVR